MGERRTISFPIGRNPSEIAMSILAKIMFRAAPTRLLGTSAFIAAAIAARTSGGRSVDVWTTRSKMLDLSFCIVSISCLRRPVPEVSKKGAFPTFEDAIINKPDLAIYYNIPTDSAKNNNLVRTGEPHTRSSIGTRMVH